MVQIKRRIDPDDHYDGGNNIQYIVIHDTGNITDSDEGNANYFYNGTRDASAHYFVDDDSITQVVEDFNGAFHCGDGNGRYGITNRNSIGIEMCRVNGTVTAKTESNTIELVLMKMKQYNVPLERIVRHKDASGKNCPSSFSANNWARWYAFKNKLSQPTIPEKHYNISMTGNIQDVGLQKTNGVDICSIGSEGKSRRLEMFSMTISNVDIRYQIHQQDLGDSQIVNGGQVLGSIDISKRIEGITIWVDKIDPNYKLQYRCHIQDIGTTNWVESGTFCGTRGRAKRIEKIEVRIVKK